MTTAIAYGPVRVEAVREIFKLIGKAVAYIANI